MEFNSFTFFFFLGFVLWLNWVIAPRWRRPMLLAVSYVFYGAWNWKFCGLIALSTLIDYVAALQIDKANRERARRWLTLSIVANLGILATFKYFSFFVASFCQMFGIDEAGLVPRIILPVGISFFTFQSMSYTIDVYRKRLLPRRSFIDFALYVSFFPQLVAGPIIRAVHYFPQLDRWERPTARQLQAGLTLIMLGLIEKIVLADNFGIHSDRYFGDLEAFPGSLSAVTGTLAFTMQIYFDFSGYSHIAIGTAHLLGYDFRPNFRRPYLSTNVAEFWRRWHISLSTWLRDYLYASLRGNDRGPFKAARNVMITMTLGGLWHGAAWHFAIWGALHGVLLLLHRLYVVSVRPRLPAAWIRSFFYSPLCWAFTLLVISLAFVPARVSNVGEMMFVWKNVFVPVAAGMSILPPVLLVAAPVSIILFFIEERIGLVERINRSPVVVRGFLVAVAIIVLTIFGVGEADRIQFIYFQF